MSEEPPVRGDAPLEFSKQIGRKAARKLNAARNTERGVWSGLGMMGLVGWSVAVPTLLGAGLGQWLDTEYGQGRSWTLMLLMAGLVIGCWNAWHWVAKEERAMQGDQNDEPK
jgi:ATP synthase protein I